MDYFIRGNDALMPCRCLANLHQGLGRGEIGVDMKTTADLKSSIEDWEQIPGRVFFGGG